MSARTTTPSFRTLLERAGVDADRVGHNLYQGSNPPPGRVLSDLGFDVLVLCAEELYQAHGPDVFPGIEVLYCPLTDRRDMTAFRPGDEANIDRTVKTIVQRLASGKRVIVCCHSGWDRSGLLTARVAHACTGKPGAWCVNHIRSCRFNALRNPFFVRTLCAIGPSV